MILSELISLIINKLKQADIDTPQLDARLLVCHALKCSRIDLLSQPQRLLSDAETAAIDALIARRLMREPVARIIGIREFWGLEFGLNEATLEPRPDSETLIEAVLSAFRRMQEASNEDVTILDLGTGTGCLLLSLLHETPNATGIGIDLNRRALEQAKENAGALNLANRAYFIQSNWLQSVGNHRFDIIVSNPPYIPSSDIPSLMPEVREYDPALALDGGKDGLTPYRFIIPQLKDFLKPHGMGAFEVGINQATEVADLFRTSGFTTIEIKRDLAGLERCVIAS